jgi:hypothetical protein
MRSPFASLALLVSSIGLSLGCEGELSAGSTEPTRPVPAGFEIITREEVTRGASVLTVYPQMTGPKSAARDEMNQRIEAVFLDSYRVCRDRSFAFMTERMKEVDTTGEPLGATEVMFSNFSHEIALLSSDLVSIRGKHYMNGGAHNNWGFFVVNCYWDEDHAEEIHLADLFDASRDWRAEFAPIVRRALAATRASDPFSDSAEFADFDYNFQRNLEGAWAVTDEELLSAPFTLSPVGIVFHYSPYIIDCFAAGDFHIVAPSVQFDHLLAHNDLVSLWHD